MDEIFINNLADVYDVFSISTETNRGETPSSLIYLPLMVEERKVGVITVQSFKDNAYKQADVTLLRTLGSYISIALDNSTAYGQVTNANEQIQEKNQQITDSLRYALTIQEAILPTENWLTNHFDSHFVLYKPKDIVSGDFYWGYHTADYNILAVIDCTGHGVPGAFMSMIGNSLLNQAIKELEMQSPAKILGFIDEHIKDVFSKGGTETTEGMDICLCRFEKATSGETKVTFAGAKRPLYFINQQGEFNSLKGDRLSIGWPYKKRKGDTMFHDKSISLPKGTQLYLTTDGYVDNHGLKRSKIGSPKLREMLETNYQKPMSKQKEILSHFLMEQQGKNEQRDDITLIGVKL